MSDPRTVDVGKLSIPSKPDGLLCYVFTLPCERHRGL